MTNNGELLKHIGNQNKASEPITALAVSFFLTDVKKCVS